MATKSPELIAAEIDMLTHAKDALLKRLLKRQPVEMASRPECKKCGSRCCNCTNPEFKA